EISAADELRVNEGKTRSQKGKSEKGQEDSSTLGWLGHSSILRVFEGIKRRPWADLLSRLHLTLGTGQIVERDWQRKKKRPRNAQMGSGVQKTADSGFGKPKRRSISRRLCAEACWIFPASRVRHASNPRVHFLGLRPVPNRFDRRAMRFPLWSDG